jgi:ACR3 family arsenite efflux pump ArsB
MRNTNNNLLTKSGKNTNKKIIKKIDKIELITLRFAILVLFLIGIVLVLAEAFKYLLLTLHSRMA